MDNVHQILYLISKILTRILSYDVITVSGNHIRIGNILLSILLFLLGIKYHKHYTNAIGRYLRTKISDKDAVNALEKLILYASTILYAVTILEIANVPLNIFAFIAGALAIGIGLGAQTLLNNFISGLIIMIERPVKINDVVAIDGITGIVTAVGARCVILTTPSNVEVLIPNSKLMQNLLVNWSLSDSLVNHKVEVTVPRESGVNFDSERFVNRLQKIIDGLETTLDKFTSQTVNFTGIDQNRFSFIINFSCDIEQTQEFLKNALNLSLLANIKDYEFTVKYIDIFQPKSLAEETAK